MIISRPRALKLVELARDLLNRGPLKNVTKLTIENDLTGMSLMEEREEESSQHEASPLPPGSDDMWGSIPYPSYLHYSSPSSPEETSSRRWNPCDTNRNKTLLAAISMSTLGNSKQLSTERTVLAETCAKEPNQKCTNIEIEFDLGEESFRTNTRGAAVTNYLEIIQAYRSAKFCPIARGDSLTSKRFFDAVLSCCIPVFLSPDDANEWQETYGTFVEEYSDYMTLLTSIYPPADLPIEKLFDWLETVKLSENVIKSMFENAYGFTYARTDHPREKDVVDFVIDQLASRNRA